MQQIKNKNVRITSFFYSKNLETLVCLMYHHLPCFLYYNRISSVTNRIWFTLKQRLVVRLYYSLTRRDHIQTFIHVSTHGIRGICGIWLSFIIPLWIRSIRDSEEIFEFFFSCLLKVFRKSTQFLIITRNVTQIKQTIGITTKLHITVHLPLYSTNWMNSQLYHTAQKYAFQMVNIKQGEWITHWSISVLTKNSNKIRQKKML